MEFIDLKAQYRALQGEVDANIRAVLDSGQFIGGPFVDRLEERLAEFTGRRHCITCASGTDALRLALLLCGVGPGDAVFCPDVTFFATAEAALHTGAECVLCDVTEDTFCLSPRSLERQVQAVLAEGRLRPRAVAAVDLLGSLCGYGELEEVCARYGLVLVEDAAQSFGAADGSGRRACSFGAAAATSFFPSKPLGCYGDGGAVFTDDDGAAALCRSLKAHGRGPEGKYWHLRPGFNSRLDSLQAAVLLPKLRALEDYELEARQRAARRYDAAFAGRLARPAVPEGTRSAWALYVLLAPSAAGRDGIAAHLRARGIPTGVYYPAPLHAQPVFRHLPHRGETFENARRYCRRTFALPLHPYLTEEEQDRVIDAVLEVL